MKDSLLYINICYLYNTTTNNNIVIIILEKSFRTMTFPICTLSSVN